ncbi:MAG: ATP-binding cassette domain-containing protein [Actinomycetaceae bacterium]|nr:ATP-binding cassette domain-containing protein [Actinomycetaceae bacterium]
MRIELVNVGHCFGESCLFSDVNFSAVPGHITALCGPSGSGKSTLLSIIAGWLQPLRGSVIRQDVASVSWVFQNPLGIPRRTIIDQVSFPFLMNGVAPDEARAQALELLNTVELRHAAEKPFAALSGGEAQRFMFARALAIEPDLLLIDEPTAQLDRRSAIHISSVICHLRDFPLITIVASHDSELISACDHIIDLGDYPPRLPLPDREADNGSKK